MPAHRLSYEVAKGPVPPGMLVRHTCDNPPCINPDHLRAGTVADNARDAVERGRMCAGERRAALQRGERNPNWRHGRRVQKSRLAI